MRITTFGVLALLLGALPALSAQTLAPGELHIPFRLTAYNNIAIRAVLNGRDTLQLMLHTAESGVTLTEAAIKRLESIRFDGQVEGVKSWGGGDNSAQYSQHNRLSISGMEWSDMTVWSDLNSGQETDGKFGLDLFEGKVLVFDFDKKELVVSDKMPRNARKYTPFPLQNDDGLLFIQGACQTEQGIFENRFLIHSGYSGALLLDDAFVAEHHIAGQITITGEQKLSDSFGNVITTKKGVMPVFRFGKLSLEAVPVGFFEGVIGQQSMSVMGGNVFKRFNWIFDAARKQVYLKPNKLYASAFALK